MENWRQSYTIICLMTKGQPADIWIGINAQVDHLPNEEKLTTELKQDSRVLPAALVPVKI